MKKLFVLLLAACAFLAGCATSGPRVIRITEAELNAGIARQMPTGTRSMGLFDVRLQQPALTLMPQENRLRMEMNYSFGAAPLGAQRLDGTLQLSYALRVEPADGTVRLAQVRVERMDLPGLPPAYRALADRIGPQVAEGLLRDMVVHRLRDEDMKTAARYGYRPGSIRVVPGAIEMTLDPA